MTEPCIPPMRIETQEVGDQGPSMFITRRLQKYRNIPGSQLSNREVWHVAFHYKPSPHDPRTEGLRDHTPA